MHMSVGSCDKTIILLNSWQFTVNDLSVFVYMPEFLPHSLLGDGFEAIDSSPGSKGYNGFTKPLYTP